MNDEELKELFQFENDLQQLGTTLNHIRRYVLKLFLKQKGINLYFDTMLCQVQKIDDEITKLERLSSVLEGFKQ